MNVLIRYLSLWVTQRYEPFMYTSHRRCRFLMAQFTVTYSILLAWVSNSIPEPSKRAIALAIVASVAGVGDVGAP